jgi:hypothetical protein
VVDILRCDSKIISTPQDPASKGTSPVCFTMADRRNIDSLVATRGDACDRALGRSADDGSTSPAQNAELVSKHHVSEAVPIRSNEPNLARPAARSRRRGGCAFLPASWVRLARDPNCSRRKLGRRTESRSFDDYAATRKKPVLWNWPIVPPQGRRANARTGRRTRPRQAAHFRALSQHRRVGTRNLRRGVCLSLPLPDFGQECRSATGRPARSDPARST